MKRVGAVIVFASDVDKETAEALLSELTNSGAFVVESTEVQEFDDRGGYPVFYVP